MRENSKAIERRQKDWRYANRWLVGDGIDIGCGPDPVSPKQYPKITTVRAYDNQLGDKDGATLPEIAKEQFNFVHSSHCLEHLYDPLTALQNWLRVLKPGGFIVCLIPDEWLYEKGHWPSYFNPDHKVSFTLRGQPLIKTSTSLIHTMFAVFKNPKTFGVVELEMLQLLTEHWSADDIKDQSLGAAECAIEFVLRKHD